VAGIGQDFARFGQWPGGQELQQHRQMIGQFRAGEIETAGAIGFEQVDHRAAPVAAFAMDVLEQVQRQGARAVEQQHIALLKIVEVARRQRDEQRLQRGRPPRGQQALAEHLADRRDRPPEDRRLG
jgi:hypothetical protein